MAQGNADKSSLDGPIPYSVPVPWDKLKDVAKNELGETEEIKKECLQQLRQLIEDCKLKCITRDDFLLRFLRARKFDVQRSFKTLQNYARQRAAWHDDLMKLQPETLRKVLLKNIIGLLPYRDKEGRMMAFYDAGVWNPDMCSIEDLFLTFQLLVNYGAESQSSQITGGVSVVKAKILPWNHVTILLRYAQRIINYLFESIPGRYKALHIVDEHPVFSYAISLIMPFLPKKIAKRVIFHGKARDDLFEVIPGSILPDDFGGNLGPLNNEHLLDELENYLKKVKEEQRYFL